MAFTRMDDPEGMDRMREFMGPGQVDQMIRQVIQFAWVMLPDDRKTVMDVERVIREIVDRASKSFERMRISSAWASSAREAHALNYSCATGRVGMMGTWKAVSYKSTGYYNYKLNHHAKIQSCRFDVCDSGNGRRSRACPEPRTPVRLEDTFSRAPRQSIRLLRTPVRHCRCVGADADLGTMDDGRANPQATKSSPCVAEADSTTWAHCGHCGRANDSHRRRKSCCRDSHHLGPPWVVDHGSIFQLAAVVDVVTPCLLRARCSDGLGCSGSDRNWWRRAKLGRPCGASRRCLLDHRRFWHSLVGICRHRWLNQFGR